jgi:hypothetical protein
MSLLLALILSLQSYHHLQPLLNSKQCYNSTICDIYLLCTIKCCKSGHFKPPPDVDAVATSESSNPYRLPAINVPLTQVLISASGPPKMELGL